MGGSMIYHLYQSFMGVAIFAGIAASFVFFVLVFIVKVGQPPPHRNARLLREARNRNRFHH
jgi:hypothetical protein